MNFSALYIFNAICKNTGFVLLLLLSWSCKGQTNVTPEKTLSLTAQSIESAQDGIWTRFVDSHDCLIDYTALDGTKNFPTAEECKDSKPNGLGWWTPIENGAMFGGLYLDGLIKRWENTRYKDDEIKVKRIVKGLMLLASVSDVEGLIARGVTTDGKSHYAMSSNDQMGGWYYGLWRYLQTDLPSTDERKEIENKLISTANAMSKLNWSIPAEPPFNIRGSFLNFDHNSSRLLFVLKSMYLITKQESWNNKYKQYLNEKGGPNNESRITIISKGLIYTAGKTNTWDQSPSVGCMRLLWEVEEDPAIKEYYRQGLENSASACIQSLVLADKYLSDDPVTYDLDWRKMNLLWQPQTTPAESETLARNQLSDLNKRSPKRANDMTYIREPSFAAWVVSLAPDSTLLASRKPQLEKVITTYQYKKIYEIWFFPLVAAYYRINYL